MKCRCTSWQVDPVVTVCALLTAALLMSGHVAAQSDVGTVLTNAKMLASLPPAKENTKGFTVDVVSDPFPAIGYLPVHISITSTSIFAADSQILLRFEPAENGYSPPQNGILCEVPIAVTQGARQVEVLRNLPQWSLGNGYKIRVFVDGIEFEDYQGELGQLMQPQIRPPLQLLAGEVTFRWLHVIATPNDQASAQANVSVLESQTRQSNLAVPPTTAGVRTIDRQLAAATNPVHYVPLVDLPKDWRQYQSFDGVLISHDDLVSLSKNDVERFQSLRDWVLVGGTLIVLGSPATDATMSLLNYATAAEFLEQDLIKYLGDRASGVGASRQTLLQERAQLQAAIDASSGAGAGPTANAQANAIRQNINRINAELDAINRATIKRPQWQDQIWSQPVAAGRVIGMKSETDIQPAAWLIISQLFGYRKSVSLRRGADPIIGDSRVRRWLIPGVAQPPVYTFIGLLTVFVILVGPIAYRRTTRAGRAYLMFAIAPCLALATTLAMFTYGVVADGFGTQARIRQLTWIDGRSGDAAERIRSTYFAGVRPVGGLRFPADAEVLGYPDHNGVSWEEMNANGFLTLGNVRVGSETQVFDSSFLPSRTQRQFVVHRPRRQLGQLTLRNSPSAVATAPSGASNSGANDAGATLVPPTLDSTFKFPLRNVVVRDQNGTYWEAQQIDSQQIGVVCRPIPAKEVSQRLGDLYNENRPLAEVRQRRTQSSYDRRIRDLSAVISRNLGAGNLISDGIFEDWLQRQLQVDNALPVRTFIAESDVSEDAIAVEGTELVKSIRYVFGTLP